MAPVDFPRNLISQFDQPLGGNIARGSQLIWPPHSLSASQICERLQVHTCADLKNLLSESESFCSNSLSELLSVFTHLPHHYIHHRFHLRNVPKNQIRCGMIIIVPLTLTFTSKGWNWRNRHHTYGFTFNGVQIFKKIYNNCGRHHQKPGATQPGARRKRQFWIGPAGRRTSWPDRILVVFVVGVNSYSTILEGWGR